MSAPSPGPERWGIAPYFIVDDVVATANHYRDMMGFSYDRFWGEPPAFCMVRRNGVTIMLSQFEQSGIMRPNSTLNPEGATWDAYIWIADADALHAEYLARGANVLRPPCDQVYECRDFEVEDCNGYLLCFGQDISEQAKWQQKIAQAAVSMIEAASRPEPPGQPGPSS